MVTQVLLCYANTSIDNIGSHDAGGHPPVAAQSWQFLSQAINARTQAPDFLYHYDAVAKLA